MTTPTKPLLNTCKTCKHWEESLKGDDYEFPMGSCRNSKLGDIDSSVSDGLMVGDCLGEAFFYTGVDFGCIHHELK